MIVAAQYGITQDQTSLPDSRRDGRKSIRGRIECVAVPEWSHVHKGRVSSQKPRDFLQDMLPLLIFGFLECLLGFVEECADVGGEARDGVCAPGEEKGDKEEPGEEAEVLGGGEVVGVGGGKVVGVGDEVGTV